MIPIYLLIGLINVLVKHNNYGIKIDDPEFHVKVRRSLTDTAIEKAFNLHNNIDNQLKTDVKRNKRYAYYKKTIITNKNLSQNTNIQSNLNFVNQNNGNYGNGNRSESVNNGNGYTASNPAWNHMFNTSRYNNLGFNNGMTSIRSYPYGYPPGYTPKTNINGATPGYTNNAPRFYNYQYPNRQNFGGYFGYNASRPGYNNFNSIPAPYIQNQVNNNNFSNILASYPTVYNTTVPSARNNNRNPETRGYVAYNNTSVYNNFNNIPIPNTTKPVPNTGYFIYNATTAGFKNNTAPYYPGNISTTPGSNTTETTTPNIVTACVICNIPCPKFMRRFGMLCVDKNQDDDY